LSTWPSGSAQPVVSTLNAPTGSVTANSAIVPAGLNGAVDVLTTDPADVVIDVNGYFAPVGGTGGLSLRGISPCRFLDTRNDSDKPALSGSRVVQVGANNCKLPSSVGALLMNATVIPISSYLGYLTLWADGVMPLASTLNSLDGSIVSNGAIVPTTTGSINVFSTNTTELVLDLNAYFAP